MHYVDVAYNVRVVKRIQENEEGYIQVLEAFANRDWDQVTLIAANSGGPPNLSDEYQPVMKTIHTSVYAGETFKCEQDGRTHSIVHESFNEPA